MQTTGNGLLSPHMLASPKRAMFLSVPGVPPKRTNGA